MKRKFTQDPPPGFDFEDYLYLLIRGTIDGDDYTFSHLLNYRRIGHTCEDCDMYYQNCTCEGDTTRKDSSGFNRECQDCGMNYCICRYPVFGKSHLTVPDKIRRYIFRLAKKDLTNFEFSIFLDRLIRKLNTNTPESKIKSSIFLNQLLNL